jgi:hypothetical protein
MYVKGNCRVQIWGTIPTFACREWSEPLESSAMTAELRAEISAQCSLISPLVYAYASMW